MTPEIKIQLESFVLATLAGDGTPGTGESSLLRAARLEVQNAITGPELSGVLRDLADRRLVISHIPAFGAHRWRITAQGLSVAQEAGLA